MTLAGAAADARIKGVDLWDALQAQPGDLGAAQGFCAPYPFAQGPGEAMALKMGLEIAEKQLAWPGAWDEVCAVAAACLSAGGQLTKAEIEAVAMPILAIEGPIGLKAAP